MSLQASPSPRGLTGWHVLLAICGFFAVIFTVDGLFVWRALATFPGEVSVTPYEDGLLYNRRIAQLDAQARLGWRAAAAATPRGVELVIEDRDGRPVQGLSPRGRLERPATETGRIPLRFTETAPGRYAAATGATTGAWDLTVTAQRGPDLLFTAERRLTWP
jgi:nitrogen fixation protein FixH